MLVPLTSLVAALSAALAVTGCGDGAGGNRSGLVPGASDRPDEPPVMVNADLPFRYPPALYAKKVQGNVTLRLFVDRDGRARADSTRVDESSGYEALRSAERPADTAVRYAARGERPPDASGNASIRKPRVSPPPSRSTMTTGS